MAWTRVAGFPRARGDGPCNHCRHPDCTLFPPRTRGWTHWRYPPSTALPVSPAHAGMDPPRPNRTGKTTRFPRARGDGPNDTFHIHAGLEFPPRTRGWTPYIGGSANETVVSPAHAGMDHHVTSSTSRFTGFPRARGDGPTTKVLTLLCPTFPPRTRGWTPDDRTGGAASTVSPACAGETSRYAFMNSAATVHPRVRGGNSTRSINTASMTGPSPRARGKPSF